jgi:hypothetical protein
MAKEYRRLFSINKIKKKVAVKCAAPVGRLVHLYGRAGTGPNEISRVEAFFFR